MIRAREPGVGIVSPLAGHAKDTPRGKLGEIQSATEALTNKVLEASDF